MSGHDLSKQKDNADNDDNDDNDDKDDNDFNYDNGAFCMWNMHKTVF